MSNRKRDSSHGFPVPESESESKLEMETEHLGSSMLKPETETEPEQEPEQEPVRRHVFLSDEEFSELRLMAREYVKAKDEVENAEKAKRVEKHAASQKKKAK